MVMGIEQMGPVVAVAGEMELHDPIDRYRIDVLLGAEAMIEGADEDVVNVEQNSAIGFIGDRTQEFPLGQPRILKGQVARHVFDQDWALEEFLHVAYARAIGKRSSNRSTSS